MTSIAQLSIAPSAGVARRSDMAQTSSVRTTPTASFGAVARTATAQPRIISRSGFAGAKLEVRQFSASSRGRTSVQTRAVVDVNEDNFEAEVLQVRMPAQL